MITFSIVEDQADLRESLIKNLDGVSGLRCVGAHADAEVALHKIPEENPDVVLMDINLPGMSGIQCVEELKRKAPKLEVLMLTTYDNGDLIFGALRAGANGYVLKGVQPDDLVQAVKEVHAGGAPMTLQVARKVINHFHQPRKSASELEQLTSREQEILRLLAMGYMYKEIAGQLGITISTIRTHVRAIYEKLHVHSRTEAAMKFVGEKSRK
jgi:DNA-binding NarL/FixJ family response regulator